MAAINHLTCRLLAPLLPTTSFPCKASTSYIQHYTSYIIHPTLYIQHYTPYIIHSFLVPLPATCAVHLRFTPLQYTSYVIFSFLLLVTVAMYRHYILYSICIRVAFSALWGRCKIRSKVVNFDQLFLHGFLSQSSKIFNIALSTSQ